MNNLFDGLRYFLKMPAINCQEILRRAFLLPGGCCIGDRKLFFFYIPLAAF
jgi:hypothetical protein